MFATARDMSILSFIHLAKILLHHRHTHTRSRIRLHSANSEVDCGVFYQRLFTTLN